MGFAISLTVKNNKIEGTLALDDIVCWKHSCSFKTDFFPAINNVLTNLLQAGSVPPEHIKYLLLTVDFLNLYTKGKLPHHQVGYIRYLSKLRPNLPPLSQSPLKKLVVTEMVTNENGINKVLEKFKKYNLPALAINPSFYQWVKFPGDKFKKLTKDILGTNILFSTSIVFNKIGYTARENLLLINTLLLPGVDAFFTMLKQRLFASKINAKILILRNNGMLFSEKIARKLPIYTAGVYFTAQIIAATKLGPAANVLVISQKADKIYLGATENYLPVMSFAPLNYQNVALNLLHPFTRSIPIKKDLSEQLFKKAIIENLNAINLAGECRQVLLLDLNRSIRNSIYHACQELFIPVAEKRIDSTMGALVAPVCIEQEHYVPYYTEKNRNILQNKLWDGIKNEAKKEGFIPNNEWKFYVEEKPIRYLPEQGSLLRLMYYGSK